MPRDAVARLWTLLLFERHWKAAHRLALAALVRLEPLLLETCERPPETLDLLAGVARGGGAAGAALSVDDLAARACDVKVTRSMLDTVAAGLAAVAGDGESFA